MSTKTVYLFHPLTGQFAGTYDAQESPLEPGVFIVPVHSAEVAPPELAEGQEAVFSDGAWVAQAVPVDPVPADEPLTDEQLAAASVAEMQRRLDAFARSWGYDDIKSAVGYVGDPFAQFDAEGVALRNWRSVVWQWARAQEALVAAGTVPRPASPEAFADAMPAAPARP